MIVIYLILLALTLLFLYLKYVFTYWKRKGFPYIEPKIPFGNLGLVASRKTSFSVNLFELHKSTKEPIIGIYFSYRPALLVRDIELVKNILTTDFESFHDRGIYCDVKKDPVSAHLFALPGQEWKSLRMKLTPTFTTGKLKGMLPTVITVAEKFQGSLKSLADDGAIVDMKDVLCRYTMDVIASTIFGMDVNTIDEPDQTFRTIEKTVNNGQFLNVIRNTCQFLCPELLDILNISPFTDEFKAFVIGIVENTIEYREKNNVTRKDFIQNLIQLRNTGKISVDENNLWEVETTSNNLKSMTIEECAAHVAIFYIAGFETAATAIAFSLYELALNPELMNRLQNDMDAAFERHNGVLTYECMNDIPLLENCVKESVRKYPSLPLLNRICTKDYQIPNSNLTIKKGTPIVISLLGILRDPEHFIEPDRFWPERFEGENLKYNPTAFIPFGGGPRTCIGLRLGKIITKIGLILLLQKYNFERLEKEEMEFDNHSVPLFAKGGINLKVTNRIK